MSGEEIDLNKLRDEVRKKKESAAGSGEPKSEDTIPSREQFQALPAKRQLEIALAADHDNVPSYIAENFPQGEPDLNKLRAQVRKMEEDKK